MPLDHQLEAMFAGQPEWPPVRNFPIDALRDAVRSSSVQLPPPAVTLASVDDRTIPGPAGEIPVRIYTPEGAGPFPLIVYFHGGGFVVGDLDTQDMIARGLSAGAESVVVSVGYRLAPEHKFPAAFEDSWAAVQWTAANATKLAGDAALMAVAGDSAGGVIASACGLLAKKAGAPKLSAILNWYGPGIHPIPAEGSAIEFADGPVLRLDDAHFFWDMFITDDADYQDFRASPMKASSHEGLPPTFIASAECDPIRDAVEAYGPVLEQAGVKVEMQRYPGMVHGFVSWVGFLPGAQAAMADACAFAKMQFAASRRNA
ncbi:MULTISPECIES: alpha/beta hydrolase [Sphingomonas]|uniref:Lipase LipH n=1 Tax=Sphingomonas bisphenolicum TaxID=296544 RepID=A0ABN5WBU4_9SPHN|nr:alpha/beta hydrolase [Sphingomonas bisphenolicum]BBF69687.1 putative lipase LipH [Sphingomonas bisphenolicum]